MVQGDTNRLRKDLLPRALHLDPGSRGTRTSGDMIGGGDGLSKGAEVVAKIHLRG